MSETEPIPPTSSVTALRIPIIKKGEYDLWSMKMRQYIAITDHILWDIITNGDQATTDPASSSVPKTSLAANARRNNEKALNILLSAIPDRHLLSFHDATNAKTLWTAIKARFGGNEASKKMQKNLLKQQFETFTIGSREELDSAYERFQHILSMLELYDATVSLEDANLKFLRSLPSVWHVVATMIRGQPGLDELEFDDLYNNLKVYELELKGVSNSNSQNIAFLSTEVKGSTLKQSTAEPTHIPKGYTQAISSKSTCTLDPDGTLMILDWRNKADEHYEQSRKKSQGLASIDSGFSGSKTGDKTIVGPVSVESVNRKKYCLVVTDDCSKFSWVFFLAYKDETYDMLHDLIVGLENKLRHKVKTIRCDHGIEFKNQLMNEFCAKKRIKREYSIARTPQQNGVAERKNMTLIEVTM
ncbi:ribonuclease H-like domain-containing protein [Tanacetum coccineum]